MVSVFLMLVISVILILIVQMILATLLLLLVFLAIGLCRPHSEDTRKETDNTPSDDTPSEDTPSEDYFLDAERCEECVEFWWEEIVEWEWEEYGINNEDPDLLPCRGLFKENEVKLPQLSAGGAFVLQEASFPPLGQRSSSAVPFPGPLPKKVRCDRDNLVGAYLSEAARFKHIDPACKSLEDAEKKSLKRHSRFPQEIGEYNTVFQVNPENFILERNKTHGRVLKSREAVRNWECQKVSHSKYEGTEQYPMHAVFLTPGCHFSSEESRKTQKCGKLSDWISQSSLSRNRRQKFSQSESRCK